MSNQNFIGLDAEKAENLTKLLNNLLADYSVFYQNARGYHWNIKGKKFFELHIKFEELYNNLFEKIDEVAERILTLGFTPEHTYSKYFEQAEIQESGRVTDGFKAVQEVLDSYKILLKKERDILKVAEETADEGTTALMSDYIREQEKLVWMYSSYLQK